MRTATLLLFTSISIVSCALGCVLRGTLCVALIAKSSMCNLRSFYDLYKNVPVVS
jgi:hypothetical protein